MRRPALSSVQIVLGCIAVGLVPALADWLLGRTPVSRVLASGAEGMIFSCCIGIPSWAVLPRAARRMHDWPQMRQIVALLALLGLLGAAGCALGTLIIAATGLIQASLIVRAYLSALKVCLLITFAVGGATTIVMTLKERLDEARQELYLRRMAEEREKKIAAEARFASLESRVRPHFLFNTLNSISALVREEPAEAERMILRLSALLRASLDSEVSGLVSLSDELAIVRDYLEIEKIRFGERLRYRIETDEAACTRAVPALSIQTLVENSMKYAVGPRREGAEIVVTASIRNGRLFVEVSDDGPGFDPAGCLKPGHGLDLLRRRLDSLFGVAASLEMTGTSGQTTVTMSVAA